MNVLFAGCSLTSWSGFDNENLQDLWVNIVSKEFNFNSTNIALRGMSNHEIFTRTTNKIIETKPNLVVVMWSELHRLWLYTNHLFRNIDNFTMIWPTIAGWQSDLKDIKKFKDTYSKIFTNNYVNLRDWLLYIYTLQNNLERLGIPFIFLRGFSNNLQDWLNIDKNNLINCSDFVKETLDFKNNPDNYMIEKIDELHSIINVIDKSKWVNFYSPSFKELEVDKADDNAHPGKVSNAIIANKFSEYYNCQILS